MTEKDFVGQVVLPDLEIVAVVDKDGNEIPLEEFLGGSIFSEEQRSVLSSVQKLGRQLVEQEEGVGNLTDQSIDILREMIAKSGPVPLEKKKELYTFLKKLTSKSGRNFDEKRITI